MWSCEQSELQSLPTRIKPIRVASGHQDLRQCEAYLPRRFARYHGPRHSTQLTNRLGELHEWLRAQPAATHNRRT